ncbi:MAG: hypothetical protein ABTQ32_21605 [Myxococcaceae bacterium]
MRVAVGLLVGLVATPVFAELPLSSRMDEELVRRRRELDQLEQRWADITTEGSMPRDVASALADLAEKRGIRVVLLVELKTTGLRQRYYRRGYAVRLEATVPALRSLLEETSELKAFTNVRDLHLRSRGSPRLQVSFSLLVYDNAALMVDAVMEPRRRVR